MTIAQLIAVYDEDNPNQIPENKKERWLKEIEYTIVNDVIKTHELPIGMEEYDFDAHFDEWGTETELLVPEAYQALYMRYLDLKFAIEKRENSKTPGALYNNALLTYQQYYTRNNRPLSKPPVFVDHTRL